MNFRGQNSVPNVCVWVWMWYMCVSLGSEEFIEKLMKLKLVYFMIASSFDISDRKIYNAFLKA